MFKDFFSKLLFGGGIVFDLFKWVILLFIALVLINNFWFTVFFVDGLSMYPTMKDKELVVLQKSVYANGEPQRGDIVAVKYPGDPDHKRYVKRVIGLPGEKISIKDGSVYINDRLITEKYIEKGVLTGLIGNSGGVWNLTKDSYFLMGDNRPGSNDSRYFGPVEKRFISGRASAIIYPRSKDLTKSK